MKILILVLSLAVVPGAALARGGHAGSSATTSSSPRAPREHRQRGNESAPSQGSPITSGML